MSSIQPRRLIYNLYLVAGMLGTIALGGAALWMTRHNEVVAEVPLVPDISVPLFQVRCFDAEQSFGFHSNATLSFIDDSMQPRLGDPIEEMTLQAAIGKVQKSLYRAPEITLGGTRLQGQRAAYRPFTPLAEAMGHPISGVVGVDAVEKYVVELDLIGGRLRLLSRVPPEVIAQSERREIRRTNRGWVVTGIVAGGESVEFSLNTGANGGITLSQSLFDRLWAAGTVRDCVEFPLLSMAGEGIGREGVLERFTLGRFEHTDLSVVRIDTCTLGCAYLRRYIVVFDFPGKRLYLRPSAEFDAPEPKYDGSGIALIRRGQQTLIDQCLPDSPASEAGFEPGDQLLQIDGDTVDPLPLRTVRRRLNKQGETVEITVVRGDERFTRKLALRDYWKRIPPPTTEQ